MVSFDPAVFAGLRGAVLGAVRAGCARITARRMAAEFARVMPDRIRAALVAAVGPAAALAPVRLPELALGEDAVTVRAENAGGDLTVPTAVQHNVPAWSLFGIFFIAVPLAALVLNERHNHIFARLLASPAPRITLAAARITAFALVCALQFAVIFAVGAWLLPLFGTDPLVMPHDTAALALILAAACFAASGYGFLVGVMARTHEQAAMFASISVVVAAAIGGVMVPVYAMPPFMRALSALSPLAWGLDGLLAIFVRGRGLAEVWPDLVLLSGFGLVCLGLSWLRIRRGGI
jgi:ABC-2 type transport system permease protein